MDIEEFEKNIDRFSMGQPGALAKLLIHSTLTLGNQEAIMKNQSKILHLLNPLKSEDEYYKETDLYAKEISSKIWQDFLRGTMD